jgi:hypothetical protein
MRIYLVFQRNAACLSGFQVTETVTLFKIGLFCSTEEKSLCLGRKHLRSKQQCLAHYFPRRIEFIFEKILPASQGFQVTVTFTLCKIGLFS